MVESNRGFCFCLSTVCVYVRVRVRACVCVCKRFRIRWFATANQVWSRYEPSSPESCEPYTFVTTRWRNTHTYTHRETIPRCDSSVRHTVSWLPLFEWQRKTVTPSSFINTTGTDCNCSFFSFFALLCYGPRWVFDRFVAAVVAFAVAVVLEGFFGVFRVFFAVEYRLFVRECSVKSKIAVLDAIANWLCNYFYGDNWQHDRWHRTNEVGAADGNEE